jgi:hypothetical protein
MAAPEVAVAFTIREKFSGALASLRRLYDLAEIPFTLYFVDGRYPASMLPALQGLLADKPNVVWIAADRFLYPSEALNLVVAQAQEPLLFSLQNDVLISRSALERLVASMNRFRADIVVPTILDLVDGTPSRHRDADNEAFIAFVEREGKIRGAPEAAPRWINGGRRIDYFELHCFLARTQVLRALGPLPPLNMHEHVDLSIALWRAGNSVVHDDQVRTLYAGSPPLPLRDFESPYFQFRWDAARARQSDRFLRSKWPIAELFEPDQFIQHQLQALRPEAILSRYESVFAADSWPPELAGP